LRVSASAGVGSGFLGAEGLGGGGDGKSGETHGRPSTVFNPPLVPPPLGKRIVVLTFS